MNELRDTQEEVVRFRLSGQTLQPFVVYAEDYDRLLAANREQKAEIERLKRIVDVAKGDRIDMRAKLDAFNSGGFADADAMAGKYLDVVNELASLRASVGEKWIDVKDCYPPDMTFVMAFAVGMSQLNGIQIARFNQNEPASMFWHGIIMGHSKGVTHWQPLPAPPSQHTEEER